MSKVSKTRHMGETLEGFIRKSGERAYQFAYSLSGNGEEAKELVQESLCRVARAWKRYDGSRPLESWFFSILRNAFLDSRKRFERKNVVSMDSPLADREGETYGDSIPDGRQDLIEQLERSEVVRIVQGALAHLSKEHSAVLRLCDMGGMNYDEVARSLGLPAGTVRSRICRARQVLRRKAPELAAVAY